MNLSRSQFNVDGLHIRACRPEGTPRGVVLFVHGATVASVLFDIPVPGYSMLEACAAAGWWSFACDLTGYARSVRPAGMQLSPADCPLLCTGEQAILDVDKVVATLRQLTGSEKLVLAGGSWGSLTAARYTLHAPEVVERLILIAPLFGTVNVGWLQVLSDPNDPERINPKLGGYRPVRREDLLSRWDPEIPPGQEIQRRDPAVLDALMQDELAADVGSSQFDVFRVPNGTLHDLFDVFSGRPLYAPEGIRTPCLLVRGADDQTSTQADAALLHARLGSQHKRWVTIRRSGHFLQAERAAGELQAVVNDFLNETF